MARSGVALLFLSLSCAAVSAAPQQIGFGLTYGGLYDGLYGGYNQYGGHYGLGHHHHDYDHYHPHYHHDYHHHHHDDYHDDYHHHHHGHYYKRSVSLPERIIPQAVSFDDISQPPFKPVIITDPKFSPVDQLHWGKK